MAYQDTLEEGLTALREGKDIEAFLAEHPEHAGRLRDDLDLVAALAAHRITVPPPREDQAWAQLHGKLVSERAVIQRSGPARGSLFLMPIFAAVGVAAVLLVLVASGIFDLLGGNKGSLGGPGEAEAATAEGIVIENRDGDLKIQTMLGFETVQIDTISVLQDEQGAVIEAAALETGQLVTVRGERIQAGTILARQVDLRTPATARRWCAENPARCSEAGAALGQAVESCQAQPVACERLRWRLQELTADLPQITRLDEIRRSCEQDGAGCSDLRALCLSQPAICEALRDGISKRLAGSEVERVRLLSQRCLAGEAVACRQLRQACESYAFPCLEPVRPIVTPTPAPSESPRPRIQDQPTSTPTVAPTRLPATRPAPTSTPTPGRTQSR